MNSSKSRRRMVGLNAGHIVFGRTWSPKSPKSPSEVFDSFSSHQKMVCLRIKVIPHGHFGASP